MRVAALLRAPYRIRTQIEVGSEECLASMERLTYLAPESLKKVAQECSLTQRRVE